MSKTSPLKRNMNLPFQRKNYTNFGETHDHTSPNHVLIHPQRYDCCLYSCGRTPTRWQLESVDSTNFFQQEELLLYLVHMKDTVKFLV
ncbi:hypothetical protein AQUCO_01100455v1 [Aquilegia coerulea]|uniref:Uncharacterized protein n=1 Tax=Aquilegia coerulea TaxID=218851 RepID=A0A2G5E780_AQUCA|nr:hypothetical protein AQUCO_01100455v1 [Aquilegia coerulea]